jgi:hypothetical protein
MSDFVIEKYITPEEPSLEQMLLNFVSLVLGACSTSLYPVMLVTPDINVPNKLKGSKIAVKFSETFVNRGYKLWTDSYNSHLYVYC